MGIRRCRGVREVRKVAAPYGVGAGRPGVPLGDLGEDAGGPLVGVRLVGSGGGHRQQRDDPVHQDGGDRPTRKDLCEPLGVPEEERLDLGVRQPFAEEVLVVDPVAEPLQCVTGVAGPLGRTLDGDQEGIDRRLEDLPSGNAARQAWRRVDDLQDEVDRPVTRRSCRSLRPAGTEFLRPWCEGPRHRRAVRSEDLPTADHVQIDLDRPPAVPVERPQVNDLPGGVARQVDDDVLTEVGGEGPPRQVLRVVRAPVLPVLGRPLRAPAAGAGHPQVPHRAVLDERVDEIAPAEGPPNRLGDHGLLVHPRGAHGPRQHLMRRPQRTRAQHRGILTDRAAHRVEERPLPHRRRIPVQHISLQRHHVLQQ
ncbi:hypothetical protein GCM10023196_017000 [Actinoallomurus vinaceus]|uniref:Uncharacterized protein n=1 Tax=Actinoallomurus vinaceus TaxID=1080074 RepID=A0ABP8U6G7_9ACTN